MVDKALDHTAKALASLSHGGKDAGPSKGFQTLIKLIGESKTKHVRNYVHDCVSFYIGVLSYKAASYSEPEQLADFAFVY